MKATISSTNISQKQSSISLKKQSRNLVSYLNNCYRWIVEILTRESEPKIQKISDRDGDISWRIYDPATNQFVNLSSETEVRIWIEKRYYS